MSKNKFLVGSLLFVFLFLLTLLAILVNYHLNQPQLMTSATQLLSDPFLQLPTPTSVRVVWFTDFPGSRHAVNYGGRLQQTTPAFTTKLSRIREDQKSRVGSQTEDGQIYPQPVPRDIWRHEAIVTGLTPRKKVPYQVISWRENGEEISSGVFSLSPTPPPGSNLKILLTSDHQLKPMTAANLQKVAETIGQVDAIFMAGDLVDIPDRASEWFDDNRGCAFFACLQGRGNYLLEKEGIVTVYHGGALIQNAPIFPAIGNHEVMGRYSSKRDLNYQFNDPHPLSVAENYYQLAAAQINPRQDPLVKEAWLKANSFNTDTYEEIFTLPTNISGQNKYYAVTFGDVRLISLFVTNIWRSPTLEDWAVGRYRERTQDLNHPENWGYGQHIFEPIVKGSSQYNWLEKELASPEFKQAKYKIVMFHHPPHTLGDNIVPAYTDPQQIIEYDESGKIKSIRYEYPLAEDYIIRDLIPLLEKAKVDLVFYGHSHLWNRFVSPSGMNFLESSNVGNTYGAYLGEKKRPIPSGYREKYVAVGDPNQLEPIVPTIDPLLAENNQPLPYIASNEITVFSILDTGTGVVSSYRFDTRKPNSEVVKFDEFILNK